MTGNIDIGENTENALAANQVTKVKAGTEMTVTIRKAFPPPPIFKRVNTRLT